MYWGLNVLFDGVVHVGFLAKLAWVVLNYMNCQKSSTKQMMVMKFFSRKGMGLTR